AVRSLRSWLDVRGAAARRRTRVVRGSTIVATAPGRIELVPFEVPLAGPGEITVEVESSVLSPGTERAQYQRLPNAQVEFPYRPGSSAAGRVVAVGRGVNAFEVGDAVAIPRVPHSSIATVAATSAYRVPSNVQLEDAAFVYLAMISAYGVRRAAIEPGAPLCVVGSGVVGALAQRLAVRSGAGQSTVIAASRRREQVARTGGATEFLLADEDAERIRALALPVVIEATGSPSAISTAIAAAGEGGRIVLLGSPRGAGEFP